MLRYLVLLGCALLLISCQYQCEDPPLKYTLVGWDSADIALIYIREYGRNTNFTQLHYVQTIGTAITHAAMDTVVLRDPERVPRGLNKDYDLIIELVNAGRTYKLSEYSVDVRKEKEVPFVPQGKCSNNITIRVNDSVWTIPGKSGGDPDLPPAVIVLKK